jgi:hypothetical protein
MQQSECMGTNIYTLTNKIDFKLCSLNGLQTTQYLTRIWQP